MSFELPITIYDAIEKIEKSAYLLPAIQREFIWNSNQIELLFDSLMKDYPISSFLFWKVDSDVASKYRFYKFINEYRERYKTHNEEISVDSKSSFTAILDGQQRLTTLYIGLLGSYAYKEYYKAWANNEWSIPTRRLYLLISNVLHDQEDGKIYDFQFLKDEDTKKNDILISGNENDKWFRVGKILSLRNLASFNKFVNENKLNEKEINMLAKFQEVIHSEKLINYYEEKEQNLDKALNIFIRINSGGEPLNFSDLLMSIAVANWNKKDARKEIFSLIDSIQNEGFSINKDFVLKTFLFLHSKDIKFKVTNFSIQNAHQFEEEWENIRDAILETIYLIKTFGFTELTLTSKNALIPIVYYIYHRKIVENFSTRKSYSKDRVVICKWLHISLVKRIFGGQSDSILTQIRKAFTNDISKVGIFDSINEFPSEEIFKSISRDVSVGDDYIEELLTTQKDDKYAFSLLALLYPDLDYKNNNFHKDHMYPEEKYTKLKKEDQEKYGRETYNSLLNLQMLDANENESKGKIDLKVWVNEQIKNQNKVVFYREHIIPNVSLEYKDFSLFIEQREIMLINKFKEILQ
jgi:uncharacterized protein with ParB-like and HNH nuclease domain